ncbi:MAG: carbohydrate binding domain-containing protein [Oscillospiraceae bacterium]|nr:carbohydrate binding domain-containing protein [Oscillospiraceae bacterium]
MNKITVTANKKASMDDFYGIFFEDINHAADGGLYGEMIRNRAFEFSPIDNPSYQALTAWKKIEQGGASVSASVSNKNPFSLKNPNYLVLEITNTGERAGIKNLGYSGGIAVSEGKDYNFSCYAKSEKPCSVIISIDDAYGRPIVSEEMNITSAEWTRYSLTLTPPVTDSSAVLAITARESCKFCIDFVSLFPADTYKSRKNGMRADIAQMLADLTPKFMRFPGGCLIHDGTLNADDRNSMYRWKNTIGDITERPSRRNNWRYNQSLGLGYYEYFLFCKDIGAKPLPVLPAGYNPHMEQAAPLDELREWIDDALDLIEFANGSADTKWGKIRADLGHSEPFNLEYLAIGNEEVGQGFWDRYDLFHKEIKEKYPEIKIINSAGPFPAGGEFERGWSNARKNGSDIVDEHYYTSPEWLLANHHRYDNYPSDGPKVFLGEYASWGNTYYNALIEAAYMTSLENNAQRVALACYAPLLANVDYVDWQPDMIWFDNHRVYGSANYYVQKMFMNNTGNLLLEATHTGLEDSVTLGSPIISGGVEIAADLCCADFYDISITDIANGTVKAFDAFSLSAEESKSLCAIASKHYKIEFTARRRSGDKCFRLLFGKSDEQNFIQWFIGGWQNQDTEINAQVNGRGSCLSHNIFSIMTGREYRLCLEVNGREITAYINGETANTAVDKQPVTEELYYTASRDESNIYIKAVNVRDAEVSSQICVEDVKEINAEIIELSGNGLDDMNDFDNPTRVAPKTKAFNCGENTFEYTFPPQSVTVFVIKNNK